MRTMKHRSPRTPAAAGFTLVEVMIALVIMAILAGLAWRGVDALMRLRQGAQQTADATLRLSTGLSQFEYDISMMVDTTALSALSFDGNTLRLTRRHPQGVQLVVWTRQDNRWQRWASRPFTHVADLQEAWMRSQQWSSISQEAVAVVADVSQFQVYCYRGNGWSNCQSSNNTVTQVTTAPVAPSSPASGILGAPVDTSADAASGVPQARTLSVTPTGLRLVLTLPGGDITREHVLPPTGARAAGAA
jgi:general secretion pathway protein J